MQTKAPLVSIITPTYNSEDTLPITLKSVLSQSFQNWEHILVDDASTDKTRDVLAAYCDKNDRAHWMELDINQGAAVARNAAIKFARGRYITFLDSDDVWLPEKLEQQLKFMQLNDIAFSCTGYVKIDENEKVLDTIVVPARQRASDLMKNNKVGCLTAMYDSDKLGKVYMPSIRKRQDLGLWLRLLRKTPYVYGMSEILAHYRLRTDSISGKKSDSARYTWRLYREIEGMSVMRASYYFSHYAFNGIMKTYLLKFLKK